MFFVTFTITLFELERFRSIVDLIHIKVPRPCKKKQSNPSWNLVSLVMEVQNKHCHKSRQ